ncbi:MAG: SDR family oxidoreductase [Pseudomonadales bacterium]|nr:SDR family oxidoreductase [Pseudomonadales bacterium]
MDMGITNKVVIVTGASKGIGKAVAEIFAEEGAKLVLCARSEDLLLAQAKQLTEAHEVEVLPVVVDLASQQGVDDCIAATLARFGQIDILINNAGAIRGGGLLDKPDADWLEDWQLKLFGYIRMMRTTFPEMERQGGGRIVNIIGNGGRMPRAGYLAGAGANAGLMAITKGVAEQGASKNILVNAVNPGPVHTPRWDGMVSAIASQRDADPQQVEAAMVKNIPLKRPAEPEEVSAVALFLASKHASYMTGEIVQVDGGAANCL